MVCFSLADKNSLQNALTTWRNELNTLGPPNCPKILVGLKADLREEWQNYPEKKAMCVTTEDGSKAKEDYNFNAYIECSAKTRFKLTSVFYKAVQLHFQLRDLKKLAQPG